MGTIVPAKLSTMEIRGMVRGLKDGGMTFGLIYEALITELRFRGEQV